MNPAEFEQQLKQLRPVSAAELLPETFYRAGWSACESQAPVRRPGRDRRRAAAFFGTGILCGLLVAAGPRVWQMSGNGAGQSVVTVKQAADEVVEDTVPRDVAAAVAVVAAGSPDDWENLVTGFSPWGRRSEDSPVRIPSAARALSPAARYHWSSIMFVEPESRHRGETGDAARTANDETQLRSFPARGRVFDELL